MLTGVRRFFGWLAGDQGRGPMMWAAGKPMKANADWNPAGFGPNALNEQYLEKARNRITDLVDNNPHISGVCDLIGNNIVNTGINPHPATKWPEVNKRIKDLWFRDAEGADIDRELGVGQSQKLWFREVFRGGECLSYFPVIGAHRRFKSGPAIELIEAERLPLSLTPDLARTASQGGNRLRQGVEFNPGGQRVAYHVYRDNPNDGGMFTSSINPWQTRRVDAGDARLGFVRRRTKQIRGVPWPVSVAAVTKLEAGFDEASILGAFGAACAVLAMQGVTADKFKDSSLLDGKTGQPLKSLSPLSIIFEKPGTAGARMLTPNLPAQNFPGAVEVLLRRMAAGLNVSYAALARDYSKATFSATRAESLEDRKGYRPAQELVWTEHTGPYYRRKIDWWILTGELKLTPEQTAAYLEDPYQLYVCTVMMPGWEWVNPAQEATADQIAVDNGFKSLAEVCMARGRHPEDVIDEQIAVEVYEREQREAADLPPRARSPIALAIAAEDDGAPAKGGQDGQQPGQEAPPSQAEAPRRGGRMARFFARMNGSHHA